LEGNQFVAQKLDVGHFLFDDGGQFFKEFGGSRISNISAKLPVKCGSVALDLLK